jgi:hypothetical protein
MTQPLPRTLSTVPQTLEKHQEVMGALRALAAQDEERNRRRQAEIAVLRRELGDIARELRAAAREWPLLVRLELRKSGFNPDEPRVPAGNPDGGEWTTEDGSDPPGDQPVASDATPDNNWIPGAQYAANDPPGIGHNQDPPLEGPPEIPPEVPATAQAIYTFLTAAAYWLQEAALAGEPIGDFPLALEAASWLSKYLPYIYAYLHPPETLEELQQDALNPQVGYNIHHIVEQTSAAQDGFPPSMIDAPENQVRIPTFVHWQISAWYSTPNSEFGGLSPRDYLRGKSWDERWRVGIYALRLFGVLAP